jgi:hypothetical protein
MPAYRMLIEKDDAGEENEIYELASKDAWEISDARSVTKWFVDAVSDLNGEDGDDGFQMRRVVRMTKAFARSREDWKERTTSGITLSKLVVDEFHPSEDRDDIALLETWKAINKRLQLSTEVAHPINPTPLASAGNKKVEFYQKKLSDALKSLDVLEDDECTRNEARAAWDGVFNTNFISKLPDPSEPEGGKKSFFVAAERRSDKRDDGNGRYGSGDRA